MKKQFIGKACWKGNSLFFSLLLNSGHIFHIALGFFLFPDKFPQSFFKQSCQLCLFQSLIYKEPIDESKDQVRKLQAFPLQSCFWTW